MGGSRCVRPVGKGIFQVTAVCGLYDGSVRFNCMIVPNSYRRVTRLASAARMQEGFVVGRRWNSERAY